MKSLAKTIVEKCDLFLFDFDGLLVDTERLHFKAYQLLLRKKSFNLPWDFHEFCEYAHTSKFLLKDVILKKWPFLIDEDRVDGFGSDGAGNAIESLNKRIEDLYSEKKRIYFEILQDEDLFLMEGVFKFLSILKEKNKNMCVVTNSSKKEVSFIKDKIKDLNCFFDHWITREDYKESKPSKDCYELAKSLFPNNKKVIGFEDSMRGVGALLAADVKAVVVCDKTHPQLKSKPKEVLHISSFSELAKEDLSKWQEGLKWLEERSS